MGESSSADTVVNKPAANTAVLLCKNSVNDSEPVQVSFTDCILDVLHFGTEGRVLCDYEDQRLILTRVETESVEKCIPIMHLEQCPMHKLTAEDKTKLPSSAVSRGIAVTVSVLVVSSDDYVLLSRRPLHMRTFPGTWVPPGGHVESGETLEIAAARELAEETGLILNEEDKLEKMAIWESIYPPLLFWGTPTRHQVVVYFCCQMDRPHNELSDDLKLDPDEVGMCIWLNKKQAEAVSENKLPEDDDGTFRATVVSKMEPQRSVMMPASKLFSLSGPKEGRITLGTQCALKQWLKRPLGTHLMDNAKARDSRSHL